jgi:hypothetical protein
MALEHQALNKLQAALGSRVGLFSMVAQVRPKTYPITLTNWARSPQVYVHSKTMIVDDVWAMIGSANTTDRSFRVDTEANIHWYDSTSVHGLRLNLWNHVLGSPPDLASWQPADFVAKWSAIAATNEQAAPNRRPAFVVAHNPDLVPQGHLGTLTAAPAAGATKVTLTAAPTGFGPGTHVLLGGSRPEVVLVDASYVPPPTTTGPVAVPLAGPVANAGHNTTAQWSFVNPLVPDVFADLDDIDPNRDVVV